MQKESKKTAECSKHVERKCKDDWTTIVKSANGDKPTDQPKDGQKDSKKSYTSNKYKAKNYFKV